MSLTPVSLLRMQTSCRSVLFLRRRLSLRMLNYRQPLQSRRWYSTTPELEDNCCITRPIGALGHQQQIKPQILQQRRCYSEDSKKLKTDVSYEELLALLESDNVQLFDVREPKEIEESGMVPRATNIPLGDIPRALQLPDDTFKAIYGVDKPGEESENIVFTCMMGPRSYSAMSAARILGYSRARHFPGGWEEWTRRTYK